MTAPACIAVFDIGKTNVKLAIVDLDTRTEIDRATLPNIVRQDGPWPHFDTGAHWEFLIDQLTRMAPRYPIGGLSVTTHGAAAALLDRTGELAAPILDYEHDGPDDTAIAYDALRPGFTETGSPRLPKGLNLGAQLHWLLQRDPTLRDRTARIVTYPQYWVHRLTGTAACDLCSLGCHTDLWRPYDTAPSSLVSALGIEGKLAPAMRPDAKAGHLRAEIADRTGLSRDVPVAIGIHDSNASLVPYLGLGKDRFSVISTGTWVIAMTMGGAGTALDPARDCLVNVNAQGRPVPSARFMGGREYEIIRAGAPDPDVTPDQVKAVLTSGRFLLPSVIPGTGPFPDRRHHWVGGEPPAGSAVRSILLSAYLAMMTAETLTLTDHVGPLFVEGPFARNHVYLDMLSAATGSPVHATVESTGTSVGSALLVASHHRPWSAPSPRATPAPVFGLYVLGWRSHLSRAPVDEV